MRGKMIKGMLASVLTVSMVLGGGTGVWARAPQTEAAQSESAAETITPESVPAESVPESVAEESVENQSAVPESVTEESVEAQSAVPESVAEESVEAQSVVPESVAEETQAPQPQNESAPLESEEVLLDSFAGSSMEAATSVNLGTTYNGSVSKAQKDNYYKFTLNASGRLTVNAFAKVRTVHYFIYDASGKELYDKYHGWDETAGQSSVTKTFDLTKGTYYFVVSYSSGEGNYSFNLSLTSANESFTETGNGTNNTFESASPISLNTEYKGLIAENDDLDYYKFTIPSSGRITNNAIGKMDRIHYLIYDTSGKKLYDRYFYDDSVTGQSSVSENIDLTKGTYYFAVESNAYTGEYSFTLKFTSANESFTETGNGSDNTMATARNISLGQTYNGQIAVNDTVDYYKFTVPATGKYIQKATAYMNRADYYIYDLNGKSVNHSYEYWDSDLGYSSISREIELEKGTYYFVVKNTSYHGNYSFSLSPYTDVTGVSLNQSKATLTQKGQTLQLKATILPQNAVNQDVEWTTSDSSVAKVDGNGLVTAGNAGTATITVRTKQNDKTASCVVTVYNISTEGTSGFVTRLYTTLLKRDPDLNGHASWVKVLENHQDTGAGVAWGFVFSTELKNKNLSNTEFVTRLYRTFLDREADAAGLASWVKQLDNGISREMIFKGFAESQEFTAICRSYGIDRGSVNLTEPRDQNAGVTMFVFRCYQKALGRNADTSGLNNWAEVLLSRRESPKQVAHGFIFSPEMNSKNLSNEEFIKVLYRVFMDREADAAGLQSWIRVLEQEGKDREHVFNGFADSPEFQKIVASYGL